MVTDYLWRVLQKHAGGAGACCNTMQAIAGSSPVPRCPKTRFILREPDFYVTNRVLGFSRGGQIGSQHLGMGCAIGFRIRERGTQVIAPAAKCPPPDVR